MVEQKMDFKELEGLLQQSFNNKDLQVVDYTAKKLLPAGENYGSIMVKIDAKIRRNKSAKEEELQLVGKTPSISESPMVDWAEIFQKELFMYAELYPVYRELEKEAGIDEKDLIDVLPTYLGYRRSLKGSDKPDEDSVLLMENLMVKGYYIKNKRYGMDVHHARKALTSLARYHVLGIVLKDKRPSIYKKAKEQAQKVGIDFPRLDAAIAGLRDVLVKLPSLEKHVETIESSFEQAKGGGCRGGQSIEPWVTITHGDFWVNNMLFHKDKEGNVDDVRFVDFQTYLYNSPLKDVALFLGTSLDVETQGNHLEELLNLYYNTFIKSLKRLGYDTSPFTKESFDHEVKRQALIEFPESTLAVKFFVSDLIDDSKSNDENGINVVNAKPNDVVIDKIMWLVKVYENMKWF